MLTCSATAGQGHMSRRTPKSSSVWAPRTSLPSQTMTPAELRGLGPRALLSRRERSPSSRKPAVEQAKGPPYFCIPLPWETEVGVFAPGEICRCLPDLHPPGWPGKKPRWTYPSPALCTSQPSAIYFLFLKRFCQSSVLP